MAMKLRVGVIGVGHLGQHHARHLMDIDDAAVVGVCDMDSKQ